MTGAYLIDKAVERDHPDLLPVLLGVGAPFTSRGFRLLHRFNLDSCEHNPRRVQRNTMLGVRLLADRLGTVGNLPCTFPVPSLYLRAGGPLACGSARHSR